MKPSLCHSYQKVVEGLIEKYSQKDIEISKMLLYNDIQAIKAYSLKIKEQFCKSVPLDFEMCPLDPQIVGEIIFPEYKIIKVIIQSMPNYHIPLNLYIPIKLGDKHPALEVPMGHHLDGKFIEENQIMCGNFAMRGFVAATFDPIGQGERDMFPEMIRNEKQMEYAAVDQHMHVALPLNMLGENLTSYFMWDCMRVIDYLCSLPYVNKNRIGVTGQSGGGAQSTFLGILDDRVSAVSPIQSSGKTSFGIRNMIGDSEQSVYGLSEEFGIDYTDLLWAIFPKRLMLNCDSKNASISSLRYIEQEIGRLYKVAGLAKDFELNIADCGHEISKQTREIAYAWFEKVFNGSVLPVIEKDVTILSKDELKCFPDGFKTCSAFEINKLRLTLARKKSALDVRPLRVKVTELLAAYFDTYTVDLLVSDCNYSEFILHTRSNDYIMCRLRKRDNDQLKVIIDSAGVIDTESEKNTLTLIPFGMYFTGAKKEFDYDLDTMTAIAGFMYGHIMLKKRLIQVITAISYAASILGTKEIEAVGSGQGGLLAICASMYCPIVSVDAINTLASFQGYFENINYVLEETSIIPGLFNICDIPDLAAITDAQVKFINPLTEDRRIMSTDMALKLFVRKATVEWSHDSALL
jgi:hypothetical protein